MYYITEEVYDSLDMAEKLKWYYCNKCNKFYDKESLGGECVCSSTKEKPST